MVAPMVVPPIPLGLCTSPTPLLFRSNAPEGGKVHANRSKLETDAVQRHGDSAVHRFVQAALHFVAAGQYGYHRDELYYLAASQHLDFGYVDFPPFIAALTALIRATLGDSLLAIHAVPALAGDTLVVIAGLMARQLGGGKWTQVAAALAVAVSPTYLGVNSLLSMDTFDEMFWVLALYVVIVFSSTTGRSCGSCSASSSGWAC